jgi:hypothetical protein
MMPNQNSSFLKKGNDLVAKKSVIEGITNDKEVKVEKALLDLNELKNQMFEEKIQAKRDHSPGNPTRPKMNTVTNNFFRETGYSTASGTKFGHPKPQMNVSQGTFFSTTGANFNPANSLTNNIENLD